MSIYHLGAAMRLMVPNVGTAQERVVQENLDDVTQLQVRLQKVRIHSNNHNEADECEVEGSYDDLGVDPRFLRNAEGYIYLGDSDDRNQFTPSLDNLRFIGIATDVERIFDEGRGKNVRIRFLDYTTLFLSSKHYPPEGVPTLSDTLTTAWRKVCDHTGYYDIASNSIVSTVERLKDRLVLVGVDDVALGKSVAQRIAKLGKLECRGGADAWAVWQTACQSVGLISFIRGDRCIVTTATDFYSGDDPPRFVWGRNVLSITERRDAQSLSSKNVCVESFNPLTMQTLEAFYPPASLVKPKKKIGASAMGQPVAVRAQDYEVFACPMPISDQKVLDQFAQRIWEERSRQELTGRIHVRELGAHTPAGATYDLLKLQAGDRIRVEIDQDALTTVQRLKTISERIAALVEKGFSTSMATFIAKNLDAITKVSPEFQVRSVTTELDVTSPETATYDMHIDFINRIDTSGSAQPGAGTRTPLVSGQRAVRR